MEVQHMQSYVVPPAAQNGTTTVLDAAPLPLWSTSPRQIVRALVQLLKKLWVHLLFFEVVTMCWGLLLTTFSVVKGDGFNSVVFTAISFVMAFLLQTRVSFSLNRYSSGNREFASLCNAVHQLSYFVYAFCSRASKSSSALPPLDRKSTSLYPQESVTAEQVLCELRLLVSSVPKVVLQRFTDKGVVDFSIYRTYPKLLAEVSDYPFDGLHTVMTSMTRRFAVLMELECLPPGYFNGFWRTYQDATIRFGTIQGFRRNPAPRVYRDFLQLVVFVFLFFFPVICWPAYGYASLLIMGFYTLIICGVIEVSDQIKEPYAPYSKRAYYMGVDLHPVASRSASIVEHTFDRLLKDLRAFQPQTPAPTTTTAENGLTSSAGRINGANQT